MGGIFIFQIELRKYVFHKNQRKELFRGSSQGKKVTVKIDGIEVTWKVKYNCVDGLYIIYKNRKYFEYEL